MTGENLPAGYSDDEIRAVVRQEALQMYARQEARRQLEAADERAVDQDGLYLDRAALRALPSPEQLIPGVLPRHAYGVLRGRDQSFKSFVALDWSLTLATGRFWGADPVQRVPVLYVAGEGAWGLAARAAAWEASRQTEVPADWFTVRQAALNLHRPGPAFDHLLEHVRRGHYGLVVVDTLRRVAGGADGNSSEMGAVIDNLDRIKQATSDGTVLAVAHTDKGDNDSRGYSGIEDDADFVWHARRDEMNVELELVKMKDGPDGHRVHLQAQPVDASLVLFPTVAPNATRAATASEEKLLATLREVFPDGARTTALREASTIPKASYHRALRALVNRGLVVASGSETSPVYTASSLTANHDRSYGFLPAIAAESQQVSPESQQVSPVSRPLGSETSETRDQDDALTPSFVDSPSDETTAAMRQLLDGMAGAGQKSGDPDRLTRLISFPSPDGSPLSGQPTGHTP